MRRGFLLVLLGLSSLAILAVIFLPPKRSGISPEQPGQTIPTDGPPIVDAPTLASGEGNHSPRAEQLPARPATNAQPRPKVEAPQTQLTDGSTSNEQHEAWVAARIAELNRLSTKTDTASLEKLLAEVRNPEPEIREAALDAITQSGNRAAIPGLREAAAQTTDAEEKQAILETIEFMSLPTLTEILRSKGATNSSRPAGKP